MGQHNSVDEFIKDFPQINETTGEFKNESDTLNNEVIT